MIFFPVEERIVVDERSYMSIFEQIRNPAPRSHWNTPAISGKEVPVSQKNHPPPTPRKVQGATLL